MHIDLERAQVPEELGQMVPCAICAKGFEMGVVDAQLVTGDNVLDGSCCPACVEYMGHHPAGRFPTIEEYRRLEAEWGTPLYSSIEEANRAHISGA